MPKYVFALVALLYGQCLLDISQAQDLYFDKTIYSLGGVERLYCSNVTENNNYSINYKPEAWMLPNLTVIYSDNDKFTFEDNIWTLAINSVDQNDLGLYHCMMNTPENQLFLVKLGLNARGPFFDNLWNTYEIPTIIGLCAAAGFMLIVGAIYFLCRFKPAWFYACNNGGRVDPWDDDDSCSSDDQERELGNIEKSSIAEEVVKVVKVKVAAEAIEEKVQLAEDENKDNKLIRDEEKKAETDDAGVTSDPKDGNVNPAFTEHL